MNVQELYQRYPKINQIISLGNENREHSPEVAQICDFIAGLVVDLIQYLPLPVAVDVAPPAPMPAPAPAWMPPPVGTPGLSVGWPQPAMAPAPPAPAPAPAWMPQPAPAPAPVDDRAEIRALLAALAAKL
jgi:hypothetical protein